MLFVLPLLLLMLSELLLQDEFERQIAQTSEQAFGAFYLCLFFVANCAADAAPILGVAQDQLQALCLPFLYFPDVFLILCLSSEVAYRRTPETIVVSQGKLYFKILT